MTTQPWTDSRTPALAIVARGDQIEAVSPAKFKVRSQSHPEQSYIVTVQRNRWNCTCQFHAESKMACLHVLAVKFRAGLQEKAAPPEADPTCEKCQSADVIQAGRRLNKSGPVRRFRCKTCGAYFSGKEGFHKRRSNPEMIAKALDLYFRGVSFRQVADHFAQAYGLKVSPMTVYRWVTEYSRLAGEWLNAQGAKVGEKWNVDETMVSIDGDKHWVWNVMDAETRFLLASTVSRTRTLKATRVPLRKAKDATDVLPTEIRTDGMTAYPEAIKREFGRLRKPSDPPCNQKSMTRNRWTPHKVVPSIRAPESNNIVERLNGSQRDRTRPMRGFDTVRGTEALAEGWRVHYDLVRTHLALGTTPGVAAGIPEIPGFKWAEILKLATRRIDTPTKGGAAPAD